MVTSFESLIIKVFNLINSCESLGILSNLEIFSKVTKNERFENSKILKEKKKTQT